MNHIIIKSIRGLLGTAMLCLCTLSGYSQPEQLFVDLSPVDGIELSPGNILSFRVNNRSANTVQAEISGRVQYRRSQLGFSYRFTTTLHPGINTFQQSAGSAAWTFSEPGLQELFRRYGKLPQGTYEYCVSVAIRQGGSTETIPLNDPDACVYYTVEDLFLINLVDPEDDAKIYEYHPMLSWVVNYPFASELTYKLRVAERKAGQNKQNAITRNNPVYQDNRVLSTSAVYPATGRPLQLGQPYVWAVDAYYKGILLGGSEVWQFTIIEDSAFQPKGADQSYIDIVREEAHSELYAIGQIKLKYVLDDRMQDMLRITLTDNQGKVIALPEKELTAQHGDNRYIIDLSEKVHLKHKQIYRMQFSSGSGKQYTVLFKYYNPEL